MTQEEIERSRREIDRALSDASHPWHDGAVSFVRTYQLANDKTRAFMHAIAPYYFDQSGEIKSAK